jgi:hypothetical protein
MPGARTLHGDASLVSLYQLLRNRQAQAQPAVRPCTRAVRLAEPLEDVRQELGIDADPAVGDADLHGTLE